MSLSALTKVKPLTLYSLAEVFEAVTKDRDKHLADVGMAISGAKRAGRDYEWMENWPPAVTARALDKVLDLFNEWKAQGVTHITTNAAFSDGNLTGPVEDVILQQVRDGRIKPATEEMKQAFGL